MRDVVFRRRGGGDGQARRWALGVVGGVAVAWWVAAGCGAPHPAPQPPAHAIALGVYGDGPYMAWETGRHRRLLKDAEESLTDGLIHVGDLIWVPCTDDVLLDRRSQWARLDMAVVYTPGDNEWTDCHRERAGGVDPLDRLEAIRRIFFSDPRVSLGGRPMPVTSQADVQGDIGLPENALWQRGAVVFSTLHMVGSENGTLPFPGRSSRHDDEVVGRTAAAVAWMDEVFARASALDPAGVVLVTHANVSLEGGTPDNPYRDFVQALRRHVARFRGPVLFVHGDSHEHRVDHPLADGAGTPFSRFTRVETFGSPDIGWVRIVVDTVSAEVLEIEPRLMRGWF